MKRLNEAYLIEWKNRPSHKPLVIRGARQVGKTTLIRNFAKNNFKNFIEINIEDKKEIAYIFEKHPPEKIIQLLELKLNTTINNTETLLFLDEIQEAPFIIAKLRYFYEQMPSLHIVAAGSLLDFALEEYSYSMPVGRIEFDYLSPMTFEEFLLANNELKLVSFLNDFHIKESIDNIIHDKLIDYLKLYLVIGGMPEAIKTYIETKSLQQVEIVKNAILTTYENDFNKYKKRLNVTKIQNLFKKLPYQIGNKFKYSNIDPNEQSKTLAKILNVLVKAKVCDKVFHSSANGIPLDAQKNDKYFKIIFIDTGLVCTRMGLNLTNIESLSDVMLINSGQLAEQFIGQHLLYLFPPYQEPQLHFWLREKQNASAEIDYVISEETHVIPIEVKSGTTGTLKSLHVFMEEKKLEIAMRFNSLGPSVMDVEIADSRKYKLCSLPLYMVGQAKRLFKEAKKLKHPTH